MMRAVPDHMNLIDFAGSSSLTFSCGDLPADAAVFAAGHEPNGHFWDGVVQYLAAGLLSQVELDSEAGMFCAGGDRVLLGQLREVLAGYLVNPGKIAQLIREAGLPVRRLSAQRRDRSAAEEYVHEPIVINQCRLKGEEGRPASRRGHRARAWGQDGRVLIVRATKKLLDRIGPPNLGEEEQSTTLMGQWYATAVFWKPQVALFVNEPTLLPVLMPLAPAATLLARFPQQVAAVLAAHGTPDAVIDEELRQMRDRRVAKTANRSVVGITNEFTFLAETYRADTPVPDLLALAMRLATTPCGPLYSKHVSPDRELDALLRSVAPPAN
jgi:hypothetical protein